MIRSEKLLFHATVNNAIAVASEIMGRVQRRIARAARVGPSRVRPHVVGSAAACCRAWWLAGTTDGQRDQGCDAEPCSCPTRVQKHDERDGNARHTR